MKNLKNKFPAGVIIFILLCNCFFSCKKDSPKDVEFSISTSTISLEVDSILDDTTNASTKYYIEYLSFNNDFFRQACDNNSVYLDNVSSVTLTDLKVNVVSPSGFTLDKYKSIQEYADDSNFGTKLIAQLNPISSGTTTSANLSAQSENLYNYFRLLNTSVKVSIAQNDVNVPPVTLNFNFTFKVNGKNH
jgi:hypothetical protein